MTEMDSTGYENRMKALMSENPDLALDIHMETRAERDAERKEVRLHKIKRALVEINIDIALRLADNCINVKDIVDMYHHILADLKKNDPDRFRAYMDYEKEHASALSMMNERLS